MKYNLSFCPLCFCCLCIMVGSKGSHFWNAYIEFLHRLAPVGGGGGGKNPKSIRTVINRTYCNLSINKYMEFGSSGCLD